MSESAIRSKIGTVVATAASATVHTSAVKITSEEDLITYFGYESAPGVPAVDTDGRRLLKGWVVFPGSHTTKALTATCGFRESTYTFNVYGYRSLVTGTEASMETDVDAVVTALLTRSNFNTLTPSTVVTEVTAAVGPAQLAGVTVWEAFITVVVVEYPH